MQTHKNLYKEIYSLNNLLIAWRKARKRKTKKSDVKLFDKNVIENLLSLNRELEKHSYFPKPLENFILHDPKTRKISKADFRDRVVHHAIVNILEPIFEKIFIYDSCAGRKNKGTLFALERFDKFMRKVSNNHKELPNNFNDKNYILGYCLKCDIKHYFQEVDHDILLSIIKKKIKDEKIMWLIKQILKNKTNFEMKRERESNL